MIRIQRLLYYLTVIPTPVITCSHHHKAILNSWLLYPDPLDLQVLVIFLHLPLLFIELSSNRRQSYLIPGSPFEIRALLVSRTRKCLIQRSRRLQRRGDVKNKMMWQYNIAATLSIIVPFNSRVHSPISESLSPCVPRKLFSGSRAPVVEVGITINCARWRRSG